MNVYVDNILKQSSSLQSAPADPSYPLSNLYNDALVEPLMFTGNTAEINAYWGLNYYADSVALLDSNVTAGTVKVYQNSVLVFTENITSSGAHSIIKFPDLYQISRLTLTLQSLSALKIGMLWVGKHEPLPLFQTGFTHKLEITGKPNRTEYGLGYGSKRGVLESFEVSMRGISNEEKLTLAAYINTVQYTQKHLVEPYDGGIFPPLYATLAEAGTFTKAAAYDMLLWDTTLKYQETK